MAFTALEGLGYSEREGVFGEHVICAGQLVGEAGEGEEQVGETVEVDQNGFG